MNEPVPLHKEMGWQDKNYYKGLDRVGKGNG